MSEDIKLVPTTGSVVTTLEGSEEQINVQNEQIVNEVKAESEIEQAKVYLGDWEHLPETVWDRLSKYIPFNSKIQASQTCVSWKRQLKPNLWRKPSRQWFLDISRTASFETELRKVSKYIKNLDCIPVLPEQMILIVKECTNLEGLATNCSQPYLWQDEQVVTLLSHGHLSRKLKHLIIFNLNSEFLAWQELANCISGMRKLLLATLPLNFPYDTKFDQLPKTLKFLTCSINENTFNEFINIDLRNYLGLTINFDMERIVDIGTVLSKLKRLTTLSLEGKGTISNLDAIAYPRFLTGLKLGVNCHREELVILLRKCRFLEHVELCNTCCDDRAIKVLIRYNPNIKVIKMVNSSLTSVGIASIFKSKLNLTRIDISCHHENCGPYVLELDKCHFIHTLKELKIHMTIYTTIKLLMNLKLMKSLNHLEVVITPTQLGNLDCHAVFSPALPYLSFFPLKVQMEYLVKRWAKYFNFNSVNLTSFRAVFGGNKEAILPFQETIEALFLDSLRNFPCLIHPTLIYLDRIVYPKFTQTSNTT